MAIGNDEHVCGLIALGDAVRADSKSVIDGLRRAGVRRTVMLTGDNRDTAAAIASDTGVDEFYAELLPEDKVRIVEKLVADLDRVAMVGDGVNDARPWRAPPSGSRWEPPAGTQPSKQPTSL